MSINADTYQVPAVVCPKCGERIEVSKVRDRSAVHAARNRAMAKHANEKHRVKPADKALVNMGWNV